MTYSKLASRSMYSIDHGLKAMGCWSLITYMPRFVINMTSKRDNVPQIPPSHSAHHRTSPQSCHLSKIASVLYCTDLTTFYLVEASFSCFPQRRLREAHARTWLSLTCYPELGRSIEPEHPSARWFPTSLFQFIEMYPMRKILDCQFGISIGRPGSLVAGVFPGIATRDLFRSKQLVGV